MTYNRLSQTDVWNSALTCDDNDVKDAMLTPSEISNNNNCID